MVNETIDFRYVFRWAGGLEKSFLVQLDAATLNLLPSGNHVRQLAGTELENYKCPICPLDQAHQAHCPTAVNMMGLIEFFGKSLSYEDVDITVETQERTYFKHTSLQKGLSSLMGIYMATSGCPVTEKLKPMVRFHLPFASLLETKYRVLSMYMLAQYCTHKKGTEADWELKGLFDLYENIRQMNLSFSQRLRAMIQEDAGINALVILNTFADTMLFTLDRDSFNDLEPLFKGYGESSR